MGSISRLVSTISRSTEWFSHQSLDLRKRCKLPEPCIFRPWFLKFLFNSTFPSHAGVRCAPPDGPHKCFVVLHSLFACQASLGLHTSPISILHSFERNGSATFYTDFFDLHDVMCFSHKNQGCDCKIFLLSPPSLQTLSPMQPI